MNEVFVFAGQTAREALKNRLAWLAAAFAFIGVAIAGFVSDVAVTEHEAVQTAFLAAWSRFCAALLVIIFVISTIVREFNDKCLELYLSLPLSRQSYFFGKLLGFFFCGAAVAAAFALVMWPFAPPAALAWWGFSLALELMAVAAFSFFCAITFNQQTTASMMVAVFFYFLARAGDDIILIANSDIIIPTQANLLLADVFEKMFLLLPRLGQFAQTDWLIYEPPAPRALLGQAGQAAVFALFISAAALFDFRRKNL